MPHDVPALVSVDEGAGGRRMVDGGGPQRVGGAENGEAGSWSVNGVALLPEL